MAERERDTGDAEEDEFLRRAEILKELRRRAGLRQQDLAELSGVSQAMISRYESGADMFVSNAERLATALGVNIEELIGIAALGSTDEVVKDRYPNRRRLRMMPEFKAAPTEVQELITSTINPDGDQPFEEWWDEFRVLRKLAERGQLDRLLLGAGAVPLRPDTLKKRHGRRQ